MRFGTRLLDLSRPKVMGILNATPDSFYANSRTAGLDDTLRRAEQMLKDGASLLDIGGASSRPGAEMPSAEEEMKRVIPLIGALANNFPEAFLSVDTWRAEVAKEAIGAGAHLINDISAGTMDADLWPTVAGLGVPYVLMHLQGTPATMQQNPMYEDVVLEVLDFFIKKINQLKSLGVHDVIIDPGFGFGKNLDHNYALLANVKSFSAFGFPILVGISRKSMICKALNIKPIDALNGTSALHMFALQQGASILRAHDVLEAVECIKLFELLEKNR